MISADEAATAAFYTGANLRSFIETRTDNLEWMGCDRGAIERVRPAAAAAVRALPGELAPMVAAEVVEAQLTAAGMIDRHELSHGQHASWVAFVIVLRALDMVCAEWSAQAAALERAAAAAAAGPPVAGPDDPEERIDALAGDAWDMVSGLPVAAPADRAASGKKRGK